MRHADECVDHLDPTKELSPARRVELASFGLGMCCYDLLRRRR